MPFRTTQAKAGRERRMISPRMHYATIAIALLAMAIFTVAEADNERTSIALAIEVLVQCGLVIGAAYAFRKRCLQIEETPTVSPILLAVFIASLIWEPIQRTVFETGRPFEMLVMFGLKNLVLGMSVAASQQRYQRWTMIGSMFLALFGAAITTAPIVQVLVGIYAAAGVCWLVAWHWSSLRDRLIAAHHRTEPSRRWLFGVSAAIVVLSVSIGAGQNEALTSLRGILPSSGGDGAYDPFARSGVRDGQALVAGTENIQSFAPIEDAPFLQSEMPSLYDVFDDTYDEPLKNKQTDRGVSLPPNLLEKVCKRMATSQQANRQFSTLRKQREGRHGDVGDLKSKALFYVAGRTPLHLRLQTYDIFDGVTWYAEPESTSERPLKIFEKAGRPWLLLPSSQRAFEFFSQPEAHALRIVGLDTNRVLAPLHLTGIHIDQVNREDLFGWAEDSIVKLKRRKLPELLSIHLSSRTVDRRRIAEEIPVISALGSMEHLALPTIEQMAAVRSLAESWVQGIPRGWSQIEEIQRRLKTSYHRDRLAVASADCAAPVTEFLFETKRGPDYQFATAASLMLRSLGYSTRLVSGFYAAPEDYDAQSRHTAIHSDDVHFWVEVYLQGGVWVTVEPTPGYEILEPPPGLIGRLIAAMGAVWQFALSHWVLLGAFSGICCLAVQWRRELADRVRTVSWRLSARQPGRRRVLATLELIESRMKAAGLERPSGQTPQRWFRLTGIEAIGGGCSLQSLSEIADWAAFAPENDSELDERAIKAYCELAVRNWTLPAIRRARGELGQWERIINRVRAIARQSWFRAHPEETLQRNGGRTA